MRNMGNSRIIPSRQFECSQADVAKDVSEIEKITELVSYKFSEQRRSQNIAHLMFLHLLCGLILHPSCIQPFENKDPFSGMAHKFHIPWVTKLITVVVPRPYREEVPLRFGSRVSPQFISNMGWRGAFILPTTQNTSQFSNKPARGNTSNRRYFGNSLRRIKCLS